MFEILVATSRQRENSCFLRKLLFLTLTSSNSWGQYGEVRDPKLGAVVLTLDYENI